MKSLIFLIILNLILSFSLTKCNKIPSGKIEKKQTLLQELQIERKKKNNLLFKDGTKNDSNKKEVKRKDKTKRKTLKKLITKYPNNILSKKALAKLTAPELNLIRAKIYEKHGYNFYTIWGENFYKAKYGYIIKPNHNLFKRLNKKDRVNENNIVEYLKKNYRNRRRLPIYTGHILREINYNKHKQRYFQDIEDKNPPNLSKEYSEPGIVTPIFKKEITKKNWFALINGKKNFFELNIPFDKDKVYLVYYYSKDKIKYIISYKAFSGTIRIEDAKNFSIYDSKGKLRRNIFLGNQEIYEKDYFYDKETKEIVKVVEKVIQNNKFIKVNVHALN